MPDVLIRDLDPEAHEGLKRIAAANGVTLSDLTAAALTLLGLSGGVVTASAGPKTSRFVVPGEALKAAKRLAEVRRRDGVERDLRRLNAMIAGAATEHERVALANLAREKLHDRVHPNGS